MDGIERNRTLVVIDGAGAPREIGRRHGEAARGLIADGLDRWLDALGRRHGVAPAAYIDAFLGATDFLPAIDAWTPELLEEARGIAEGAGQPFATILAFNLLDEEWAFAKARSAGQPGCSVAGIQPDADAPPVLGQTMDIPSLHDGCQIALRVAPDDRPAAVLLAYAGMIGLTGANDAGIGVVVNNLETLPTRRRGLPVAFVLRGILARATLSDAAAFVQAVPHATGQHYAIGAPEGSRSFEGWGGGVAETTTAGRHLFHTNHPLAGQAVIGDVDAIYARSRTRERLACLEAQATALADRSALEQALADTSVPISIAPRAGFMTFGAIAITLTAPPDVRIAPGPPHLTPFAPVPFSVRNAVAAD